jgi:hypothetical protein
MRKGRLSAKEQNAIRRKTMSATITPFTPGLVIRPVDRRQNLSRKRAENVPKRARTFELETRLWKLAARPANCLSTLHQFSFAVLFLAGPAAKVTGFTETSHLLKSDAIRHVAKRAIDGDLK